MNTDLSVSRIKQFPVLMWILLFGSLITRGSFYMVWPFLAVILYNKFGISATQVGLILTSAATVSVIVGFIGGALSDIIGRQRLMYGCGFLYVFSFSLLAEVSTIPGYVVVMTLCSIANSLWRPLTSALIGDIISDSRTRELAMQARYFMVNVGAALGPMIGVWVGLTGEQSSFYITAFAFALLLILLALGFMYQPTTNQRLTNHQPSGEQNQLMQTIALLTKDKVLQVLISANILCMFIYGQMDSSLIQYLTRAQVPELLELISSIIFTNAMVIISSQFFLLRMMASIDLIKRIQIGLVLLFISQFWFALNPVDCFWGWIGAVIIMSLAEAVLFPTMNVHIDRLAPEKLRGAYFGAASFYELGFAFAPLLGGIILDKLDGTWLFLICSQMSLAVIYLYRRLAKLTTE